MRASSATRVLRAVGYKRHMASVLLLCWLALAVGSSGCTGIRVGPIGLGVPVVRVDRQVILSADWSADDRYVIIWKHTSKSATRVLMLLVPVMTGESSQTASRITNEILVLNVNGRGKLRKLGDGRGVEISPGGSYLLYTHRPTGKRVWVNGKDFSIRQLWLANYVTGEKWKLDEFADRWSFSRDGKWLTWGSEIGRPQRVVNVERPAKVRSLGTELEELETAGWTVGRFQWSTDGGLYCVLGKIPHQGKPGRSRYLRFAPPDWKMTDLGESLSKDRAAGFREDRSRFSAEWVRSHDGTMLLRKKRKKFRIPYFLTLLSLPEGEVVVQNLYVELRDGSSRRLTYFWPPLW